jgi:hypothetical protein
VAEWSIAAVLKTVGPARAPGVRIPPSPPNILKNKKISYYVFVGLVAITIMTSLYFIGSFFINKNKKTGPEITSTSTQVTAEEKPTKPVEAVIPESFDLIVPYTVQAPYANWKVHEESCEEAALLMAHQYLLGQKTDIDPATADREFRAQKAWQVKNWGAERDLPMQKIGEFTQAYYGNKFRIIPNITTDQIKAEVSAGRPVMVPVMTQSLKNPHYSPGNVYHILLIKGYDATGVITNDAGVKEGKDWHYNWEILWPAIDAANTKINQGRAGLVLTKS